ncbi:L-arabinose isomerase [Arthrobacter sunyaminii]|uniref:L-arabinose isomerase n=1 Tax=Arthrobacter sunyaminii TaxID=2816859 RepID=UPI001A93BB51|nr:L-arabinose isomerase [Arthrobacter sunyaminii]MBO0895454.1 L-arabinose isomerase [Arthrobacter sunyaminii]
MTIDTIPAREIWFLTGSQGLYGEDTLAQVREQASDIARQLDDAEAIPYRIVFKPVLKDSDAIQDTILEANSSEACIGLIAWMHTFSPAKMWIRGLTKLQRPLLHLHTQHNVELPWADIDMDFMNLNQAAHGDREFAYMASRLGISRKTVVGHVSSPRVQAKIDSWARAAAGWHEIRNLKLARFGDNMRNVAVTEGDKTEAEVKFGVSVNTWSVNELAEAMDAVTEEAIDALVAEYEEQYDVVPELRRDGGRHKSLRYGARQELGLRSFLESGNFGAFTTNFEDLGALQQLPGLAVQRLMAKGYGFGAEGDWKTAVLVRIAKVMGEGLPGGASLMEDYTYNLVPGSEVILGAHMLEICPSLTTSKPALEIHPLGIGGKDDPVRLVFTADPGPAVVVSLADMRERFRLTANLVENVVPEQDLPNLPVARAVWKPAPDLETSAECWLSAGGAHHTVMSTALGREVWEDFAQIADVELAMIDDSTTTSAFVNELKMNQAYYRLAQGF